MKNPACGKLAHYTRPMLQIVGALGNLPSEHVATHRRFQLFSHRQNTRTD